MKSASDTYLLFDQTIEFVFRGTWHTWCNRQIDFFLLLLRCSIGRLGFILIAFVILILEKDREQRSRSAIVVVHHTLSHLVEHHHLQVQQESVLHSVSIQSCVHSVKMRVTYLVHRFSTGRWILVASVFFYCGCCLWCGIHRFG